MERTGTTCGNGHSFDGVTQGKPCPLCGSRSRIVHVSGAATARATASATLTIETWRELYERHGVWLSLAALISLLSFTVTRLLLDGSTALVVSMCSLLAAWAFRKRGFKRKRVRVIEHHR